MTLFRTITFTTLLVLGAGPVGVAGAEDYDSGIIHFHTYTGKPAELEGVVSPYVPGGELIIWWNDIEHREGKYDWNAIDAELKAFAARGKMLDIRLATVHDDPNNTPAWLYDKYNVRRVGRGHFADFEGPDEGYRVESAAKRTGDPEQVISGKQSLMNTQAGLLLSYGDAIPLDPKGQYSVQFDYRVLEGGALVLQAVTKEGGAVQGRSKRFELDKDDQGSATFTTRLGDYLDYRLEWRAEGDARVVVDAVHIMKLVHNLQWQITDFEKDTGAWQLLNGAKRITDKPRVIQGKASVLGDSTGEGFTPLLQNHPEKLPMLEHEGYAVLLRVRAITDCTVRYQLRSRADGTLLDERERNLAAGEKVQESYHYPHLIWKPDCVVEIGLVGPGAVVFDDAGRLNWSERVACFPDYFDPVFKEKWERLVAAFAERYRDHPNVGLIGVGGFGRWEEVMLDDDVAHGALDAQWLARGFTQERYLAHVEWCMDLYKRLLPDKRHRICLAYGLQRINDVDWVYRRVAQAAVERGIGLKQNGMSEMYDTWNDNTNGSYVFDRYRYAEGITLTHETGGQIYRNLANAHGHPISLLNRAMINGIDYLFLYGPDISEPNVNRYFHYANEQMGRTVFSKFYSRLGDYSMVNQHSPVPVDYKNNWLGLRQFQLPGAFATFDTIEGEKCAYTSGEQNTIAFDVDDRQQYAGMYGVTISVEYFDDVPGTFAIGCQNSWTDKWNVVARIQKKGEGRWKTVSYYKSDWCRSPRNSGEDTHVDLVVHHLDDSRTAVRNVELNFVPALDWERERLMDEPVSQEHLVLSQELSRTFEAPADAPLCSVAVPLWTAGLERNRLRARVYAVTDRGEQRVSEKEYYLAADGDWFEIPFAPVNGCGQYRVELFKPEGEVGWYKNSWGNPALRVMSYATTAVPRPVTWSAEENALYFDSLRPFTGLDLQGLKAGTFKLEKKLVGGGWHEVAKALEPVTSAETPDGRVLFEAQTPGQYRLHSRGGTAEEPALTVLTLRRRVPSREPVLRTIGTSERSWDLSPSQNDWTTHNLKVKSDRYELTDIGAALDSPTGLAFEARANDWLGFEIRNETGAAMARLWWAGADEEFRADRSVFVPVVPNDDQLRRYWYPVGNEDGWIGTVDKLRFEPVCGITSRGTVELSTFFYTKTP